MRSTRARSGPPIAMSSPISNGDWTTSISPASTPTPAVPATRDLGLSARRDSAARPASFTIRPSIRPAPPTTSRLSAATPTATAFPISRYRSPASFNYRRAISFCSSEQQRTLDPVGGGAGGAGYHQSGGTMVRFCVLAGLMLAQLVLSGCANRQQVDLTQWRDYHATTADELSRPVKTTAKPSQARSPQAMVSRATDG